MALPSAGIISGEQPENERMVLRSVCLAFTRSGKLLTFTSNPALPLRIRLLVFWIYNMTRMTKYSRPLFSFYRDALVCMMVPLVLGINFSLGPAAAFSDDASGSTITQLVTLFFFGSSLTLAIFSRVSAKEIWYAMLPLIALLLLAAVSVLWSDFPLLTVRRAGHLIIEAAALVLLALTYRGEPERVLRLLFYVFAVVAALNLASLAIPSVSFSPIGFSGIHLHKNYTGDFFFLALPIFLLGTLYRSVSSSRVVAAIFVLICICLLPLTQAKTALICIPLSIVLTLLIRLFLVPSISTRVILPIISLLIVLAVAILIEAIGINTILDVLFGDATLTGRDSIWQFTIAQFDKNPLFGIGYGALWQTGPALTAFMQAYDVYLVNQAHNGYIEIMAQLGIVGLAFCFVFLIFTLLRLISAISQYEIGRYVGISSYALYLLVGSIVYNLTDSTYFRSGTGLWELLIFISTCATVRLAYVIRRSTRVQQRTHALRRHTVHISTLDAGPVRRN
jgi:O-antigen ligase